MWVEGREIKLAGDRDHKRDMLAVLKRAEACMIELDTGCTRLLPASGIGPWSDAVDCRR